MVKIIVEVCSYYAASSGSCAMASINTMTAIAIDRYLVIVKFSNGHWENARTRIVMLLLLIWVSATFWMVTPFFGWGSFMMEGYGTTCTYDYLTTSVNVQTFLAGMLLFEFIIPLVIMVYAYGSIYISVRESSKELEQANKRLPTENITGNKFDRRMLEIKVAKTALFTLLLFCIAWLPYVVLTLLGMFNLHSYVTPIASTLAGLLAKSSTAYNPFIYTISHDTFRKRLSATFGCRSYCFCTGNISHSRTNTLTYSRSSFRSRTHVRFAGRENEGQIVIALEPVCPKCKFKLVAKSVLWQEDYI